LLHEKVSDKALSEIGEHMLDSTTDPDEFFYFIANLIKRRNFFLLLDRLSRLECFVSFWSCL
jgi:hypothetical protein